MTSLFSITIILTTGRIRQAEHNALAYLYHATNGPSWTNNNGWDVGENGTDPCRRTRALVPYGPRSEATVPYTGRVYNATPWFGVGCLDPCDDYLDGFDCTAGRISSILLRENGMSGSTTGWTMVGEMRNLTVLDLSYNSITGVLPTELGRIHNLDSLQLRDNSFIGDLPTELSRFNAPDGLNRTFGSGELKRSHWPTIDYVATCRRISTGTLRACKCLTSVATSYAARYRPSMASCQSYRCSIYATTRSAAPCLRTLARTAAWAACDS